MVVDPSAVTTVLAPVLPYLTGVGGRVADQASSALADAVVARAKAIWGVLRTHVDASPVAAAAATELARAPEDAGAQEMFAVALKQLLSANPELDAELGRVIEVHGGITVASGDRAIAIGGSAAGTFITGDDAKLGD